MPVCLPLKVVSLRLGHITARGCEKLQIVCCDRTTLPFLKYLYITNTHSIITATELKPASVTFDRYDEFTPAKLELVDGILGYGGQASVDTIIGHH
jgi:hypothetical protein